MDGRLAAWLLTGVVSLGLAGCSCGGGATSDGVPNEVTDELSKLSNLSQQVNGDYSKLTPEQKQQVLKIANNDPKQAADIFHRMAHSPAEQHEKKN
jgi:hypothetical protein